MYLKKAYLQIKTLRAYLKFLVYLCNLPLNYITLILIRYNIIGMYIMLKRIERINVILKTTITDEY